MDAVEPPLIFFLPGIGEGEAKDWEPFKDVVRIVPLSYLNWTELVKPEATFADLVSHLKRQIENKLTDGPLHLVGYSIGGPLAYACALALQSEGRIADSLTILDGRTYGAPRTALRERWDNLTTFRLRAGFAAVIAKVLTYDRALPLLRRLSPLRKVKLPFSLSVYLDDKLKRQLMGRGFPSWWRTIAPPSSGLATPTFLFRSEEQHPWESGDFGWGNYCSNLTVLSVPGSHFTILAPETLGPLCAELVSILRGGASRSVVPAGSSAGTP